MKQLQPLRRLSQTMIVCGFALLPWIQALGIESVTGSLFALKLGWIPFADPVATLGVIGTGNWPKLRLLFGALLSLIIALIFGRIFCGWICPYGFFSELVHKINPKKSNFAADTAFNSKCIVLALAILIFTLTNYSLLNLISFPGELSLIPLLIYQHDTSEIILALAIPAIMLLVEAIVGKRLWCRYVCPQSVLLGLAAKIFQASKIGLKISWQPNKCSCKGSTPCKSACSLGLNPRHLAGPNRRDCIQCGKCVDICKKHGQALAFGFKSK